MTASHRTSRRAAAGLALAWALSAPAATAAERCIPLAAQTTSERVTQGCASPVGVCTAGSVSGVWLNGEQRYTAALLVPAPGGPGSLIYAGTIEISTPAGQLTISDLGVFNTATGAIAEVGAITGGTGTFAGASGKTYLVGRSNEGGGFDGTLTGSVCLPR